MAGILLAPNRPLWLPGGVKRALIRPDLRGLVTPRLSGAPLGLNDVEYDDLIIHQAYRSYDELAEGKVRYFMYELSQRNPGEGEWQHFWKAVRLIRVTRVPRYLRQSSANGPGIVFDQQRDLLAALREQQVLFLNLIAKSPQLPMIFAYGVQAVADTPEEAQLRADESLAILCAQLDGLFQQLEYEQLSWQEGELLARYQAEWRQIAMARGRPLPSGSSAIASSALDGNRTDVENTLNQLEAFLRGAHDKSFLMSLVTVPISPEEMTSAWRNIANELSNVRSEQQGSRSFTAGVAIPLSFGQSLGRSAGDTHSTGTSMGIGRSDGTSHSVSDSVSSSQGSSVSHSVSSGQSVSHTVSSGQSVNHGQSLSDSVGHSVNQGASQSASASHGTSTSEGQSVSLSEGQNASSSQGASVSSSQGQSSSFAESQGANWGQNMGQSLNAGTNSSGSWNQGGSNGVNQSFGVSGSQGGSFGTGNSQGSSRGTNGGLPGVMGGSSGSTDSESSNWGWNAQTGANAGVGSSTGQNWGVSGSYGQSLGQGLSWGESLGGSQSQTAGVANSVGVSEGQSVGSSQGTSVGVSQGASVGTGTSTTAGVSSGTSVGASMNQGRSLGVSSGESTSVSQSTAQSTSVSQSTAQSLSSSQSVGRSNSTGVSSSLSSNQGYSDAYMVALSRSTSATASIGAVPSVGVSISKATFDEAKRSLGDVLQAQMQRYVQGIETGGFLYQMFLVCEDRTTLLALAGLMKSVFWGPGGNDRLPQPFHMIYDFEDDEAERLLVHGRALTSYRKREHRVELVEPYVYSSYVTPLEAATFCHPPTAESVGLLAVHDSMPVLAMPADRQDRELRLGRVVNGERGRVSEVGFGIDVDELTHTLIAGTTGSGKTTTLMTLLSEIARYEREIVEPVSVGAPTATRRVVRPSILALDWMSNMRDLGSVVSPERFKFFSIAKPELGRFRFNPLAIPEAGMSPVDWLNDVADNMTISFNLGEFGRSLIAEFLADLYTANRLEPFVLRHAVRDENGVIVRAAIELPAVSRDSIPEDGVRVDAAGREVANVFSFPELSRLLSMEHLAVLVMAKVEELANPDAARLYGTAMRDRLQSLWRRVQYFAPGSVFAGVLACDEHLEEPTCLSVRDLVNPETGMVTVIEADGLDLVNRRFILGSVLMAVWRFGQHYGDGVFDNGGMGPGTIIALEESHELFGSPSDGEDAFSAATRTALYESLFRRARALGLKLIAVAQQCSAIPAAVTSNTNTVFIHRQYDEPDRKRAFNLLNWSNQIGQQQREWRYLGEMARGYCIVRLDAKDHYLESAPIQIRSDLAAIGKVSNEQLRRLAGR